MRLALAMAVLLAFPMSGCLEAPATMGLFQLAPLQRADATLVRGEDCPSLHARLEQVALDEARVALELSIEGYGGRWLEGDVAVAAMADSAAPQAAAREHASGGSTPPTQASGTNNQEASADEGDLVKTDGEWTYVVTEDALHILHSKAVGDLERVARVALPPGYGGELLLAPRGPGASDDRLVVVRGTYDAMPETLPTKTGASGSGATADAMMWHPGNGATRIQVYSLADRTRVRLEHEVVVEGTPSGLRLVDGTAYAVVQFAQPHLGLQTWAYPDEAQLQRHGVQPDAFHRLPAGARRPILEHAALEADARNVARLSSLTLEDHLPALARRIVEGAYMPHVLEDATCRDILLPPQGTSRSVTTIVALDVAAPVIADHATQVLGGSSILYATGGSLVMAAPAQDTWWMWAQPDLLEATDLHWLDLDGLAVTHRASGRVPGTVLDSFSLDVEGDQLRVATTTGTWGRWWVGEEDVEPMMSHVATFRAEAGLLVPTGIVGGIAPGERIWSARFTPGRAYIVTFRQMDPLWVIDLAGPAPTILGELEIPGVSTYLHPLSDDLLLAIGHGADEEGNMRWEKVEASLFDIRDPASPQRAALLDLSGTGWSTSGALQEHRAFTYWDQLGLLAVPVTSQGEGRSGEWSSTAGLRLVEVDAEARTLGLRGTVDQTRLEELGAPPAYAIERSFFTASGPGTPASIQAVSFSGITSHDAATLTPQDAVAFTTQR